MTTPGQAPHRPVRSWDRATTHHDLSIHYEGRSQDIPTRVPDISPQGMFINTAQHFPDGAVLKVRFRLTRSNYEVVARGEVRYCLENVGIGLEFVEITEEAQAAIAEEIAAAMRP